MKTKNLYFSEASGESCDQPGVGSQFRARVPPSPRVSDFTDGSIRSVLVL